MDVEVYKCRRKRSSSGMADMLAGSSRDLGARLAPSLLS